jgi:hypothetical protein
MLRLGLSLAHELLDAPLPDYVLQQVAADPSLPSLAATVRERLFGKTASTEARSKVPHAFYLRAKERVPDKLRYLCYQPLTRTVRMTAKYADRLFAGSRP